ncbi:MAG: T9SS type A sorting domain-containing protein [Sphingobacteriales bacterium JAD_PAG50586_3]|nr:MAG: T9SS type A sorting domain-containing protein [Sphingobacteriales bacterium JAD_PAG50586_3]
MQWVAALAGAWGNLDRQQGIKGVFCLSGAAFDTTFIDADENIPTFMVHGTCDPVVCYGTDAAFHCNNTYPDIYGGADIATRMDNLGHNYYLYTGQDMGHDVGPLANTWLIEMMYFMRKNVLCGEPIQKHVIGNLNPDSGECATLESGPQPGGHIRYNPASLSASNAFANFPAPCALTIGVDENKTEGITIYPNPAQDFITIDMPIGYNKSTLQILNMHGQLVYSQTVKAGIQNIQLDNLATGLYMVTLQADGKRIYSGKLLIEK